jgi:hypothetical protein
MNNIYSTGLLGLLDGTISWGNDPIKALIVDNTYTFDKTHEFVSDVATGEVTNAVGIGYERKVMLNTTITLSADVVRFLADDLTYTNVNTVEVWDALIVYVEVGTDSTSPVVAYLPIDAVTTNGTSVTVAFADVIRFDNT